VIQFVVFRDFDYHECTQNPLIATGGTVVDDLTQPDAHSPEYARLQERIIALEVEVMRQQHTSVQRLRSMSCYKEILQNVDFGVAMISPDMCVMEYNRRMAEWFPRVKEGSGRPCYSLFNEPPGGQVCSYCPLIKTLQDGRVNRSVTVHQRNGNAVHLRIVSSPIRNTEGEVVAAIAVIEDITEQVTLQRRMEQVQKLEGIARLAGGVAHDFNNLLQVILVRSQFALEGLDPKHASVKALHEVITAADRAARLTQQLLAFSRQQLLKSDDLNLNRVIRDLLDVLQRLMGEDVVLRFTPGHHLGTVHADPSQLEQVLLNLCVNARDAIRDGGKIEIETENVLLDSVYCQTHPWAQPGRYVLLSVSDTGCGMNEDTRRQIFEPFFTTKEPGSGTGLGLATVYGIVKQHRGLIHVYSEVGQGSRFRIYLPISARPANSLEKSIPGPLQGGQETILVAEDDPGVRSLVAEVLGGAGYEVIQARDGDQALQMFQAQSERIDLVLQDVVLPGLSGDKLRTALLEVDPDLRLLYCSGYSPNTIHDRFVLNSKIDLLQKPFSPEGLLRKVREVLDRPSAKEDAGNQ
jgi:two-component system cell cycle sensor histidine kinase/response regulator CckA